MKAKAWGILCLLAVVTTVSTAGAQAPGLEVEEAKKGGTPVGRGLWRLAGDDPFLGSSDDLAPLRRMVGKATVVGLGEGWHTSGGFYKMKHRIFRDLVENMGFRAFGIESHWVSGEKANQYVQTCEGSPEEALDSHILDAAIADLDGDLQRTIRRQCTAREARGQRFPFEILEHEKTDRVGDGDRRARTGASLVRAWRVADVIQSADVRVIERRDRARFTVETVAQRRVGGELRRQDFDCDAAIKARVARAIHLAHAARPDERHDFIGAESRTR